MLVAENPVAAATAAAVADGEGDNDDDDDVTSDDDVVMAPSFCDANRNISVGDPYTRTRYSLPSLWFSDLLEEASARTLRRAARTTSTASARALPAPQLDNFPIEHRCTEVLSVHD